MLDLRKPQDQWTWDNTVIPKLKKKLDSFVMEYVKLTKKIYVLGGRVGEGNSNPDGEASNEVIITIKLSNALQGVLVLCEFHYCSFSKLQSNLAIRNGLIRNKFILRNHFL